MDVKSGIGNFHIEIDRAVVEGQHLVLLGTVDEWDSRTVMTARELLRLTLILVRPGVLLFVLKQGLARRRADQREAPNG